MKKIVLALSILLGAYNAKAIDYVIELTPANNSVGDAQVSSLSASKIPELKALAKKDKITNSDIDDATISTSKISSFATDVISAMTSTLSDYFKKSDLKAPTSTKCTVAGCTGSVVTGSASGTYTLPSGVKWIRVRMVGGGGGGHGIGGSAGGGTTTSFGSSFLTCTGGAGAAGIPGTASVSGSDSFAIVVQGGYGQGDSYDSAAISLHGAMGAGSPLGIGGGGMDGANPTVRHATGYGAGGGGGRVTENSSGGSGGSSGGYIDIMITSPLSSYAYLVGSGGVGAANGGNGSPGVIFIEEYYQ